MSYPFLSVGFFPCWIPDEVRMWVYEETLPTGEKLTDVINLNNVMFC